MLVERVDPWLDFIQGDPEHRVVLVQIPNYLPLLYVMLAPLGAMPLTAAKVLWLIINVTSCFASSLLCSRFYGLRSYDSLILLMLLLMSTTARNSIGLGQQSLLVLLLWAIALCTRWKRHNTFTFGLSYFKYSFAPPGFLFLLAEKGWTHALLSLVPASIAFFLAYFWLGGVFSIGKMFFFLIEPLIVAQRGYTGYPGPNLMEIIQRLTAGYHLSGWASAAAVYVVPIFLAGILIFHIARHKANFPFTARVAFLTLISLALFKHHTYDSALLLFPAALALRYLQLFASKMVIALLCFCWFLDRLIDQFAPRLPYMYLVEFAVFVLMGFFLYRIACEVSSEMREPVMALQ